MSIPYENLPSFARGPMRRWIENGFHPGGFLWSVLTNDLKGVVADGVAESLGSLVLIVRWLNEHAPDPCWGSKDKAWTWLRHHARLRLEK